MMNKFISCPSCLEEHLWTYATKALQEKLVWALFFGQDPTAVGHGSWQLQTGVTLWADEAAAANASLMQQAMEVGLSDYFKGILKE